MIDLGLDSFELFLFMIAAIFFVAIIFCVTVILTSDTYPNIVEFPSEDTYIDPTSGNTKKFASINNDPTVSLTVVVPAYNEEQRLPPMMDDCLEYLEHRSQTQSFTYEVIVVDDGSTDHTTKVTLDYAKKYGTEKIRCLTLAENRGKGGAVRLGMLRSRGELLLFADADGATTFADYDKVESGLKSLCTDEINISESLAISCGSRAHLEKESVASRSYFRTVLMYGFHFVVWFFTVRGIKDTQCGFKLFTRRTARIIFNSLHVEKWAFDVEVLYMAQMIGIPAKEVSVRWTEIDGSKVTPVLSWIQMGRDLILISLRYTLGAWRILGDSRKSK